MTVYARSHDCDRIRSWISAALDGELSELESALVQGHLRTCASCSRFEAGAAALTKALRAAPLERPTARIAVPRRRRLLEPLRVPAVAALAVSAIALGGLFASLHSGSVVSGSSSNRNGGAVFDDQSFRQLHLQSREVARAQLRARRAQEIAAALQVPRHPGFVNP
jgi:predicted anti-sigma-YlaC factor YlaD